MPETIVEEAINSAYKELEAAKASHSLYSAAEAIEKQFGKLGGDDRLKFLAGLNDKAQTANLIDFQIDGINIRHHTLIVSKPGDTIHYEAANLDKLEEIKPQQPDEHVRLGERFPDSPTGPTTGSGMWLNVFNYPGDIKGYVAKLHKAGIENLFVQTHSRDSDAIAYPDQFGKIIEECHANGIKVIAWSYPYLKDPEGDADKLVAAAKFVSPKGQVIDGIAADLEENITADHLEKYSKRLRDAVGANYPAEAIVWSPLNLSADARMVDPSTDAGRKSYELIPKYFDAVAPMDYWSGAKKLLKTNAAVYTYNTIKKIEDALALTGVRIDVIGDAMDQKMTCTELKSFMDISRSQDVHSISFYPYKLPTQKQLDCIQNPEKASKQETNKGSGSRTTNPPHKVPGIKHHFLDELKIVF